MATIVKRAPSQWQATVGKRGYQTQSKTLPTKAKAEQWARLIESEMNRGIFMSTRDSETMKLEELFSHYQSEVAPNKNGEDRKVPLSSKAAEILHKLSRNINGKVFDRTPASITRAFNRICS